MADCSICCEKFNKSSHAKVTCSFCDFETCRSCVQQYLLSTSNDPHCMNCKNVWGREFIDETCTKTFRNKALKTHRENILLDREKCLMPETQPLVLREKRIRETEKVLKEARISLYDQQQTVRNLEDSLNTLRNGGELVDGEPS